ncbi:C-type lectin domain family 2 member L-like [Manacus vitellinus]|nr:C-type lectin domain family 2 member L-like [Manacus vitellinus]
MHSGRTAHPGIEGSRSHGCPHPRSKDQDGGKRIPASCSQPRRSGSSALISRPRGQRLRPAHECRGAAGAAASRKRGAGSREDLFSNIWLWRAVAGVLSAAVILISCVQFVNLSSAKDFPVCPSLEVCPSGWLYFQRKCYYLSENEADWNSSQSHCSLHNASLLVIKNHQELSFMMKITKQDPWIGLYKRNEEFFWVNGKALDNELIEVKGSGNCAYLESKGVSASGCYLTRKWVCSLTINSAR